jgi:hypothetical protein
LTVEALEDRRLLSLAFSPLLPPGNITQLPASSTSANTTPTDMTQLAAQLQSQGLLQVPSGPTALYLNFDGWTNSGTSAGNVGAFPGTPQDRADILYRTAEVFAPFNVQVGELSGDGNFVNQGGATTIFVGPAKGQSFTPGQYNDYPSSNNPNGGTSHLFHTDGYNLSVVDSNLFGNTSSPQHDVGIVTAIAHEAGHTFGLAHVRTDGQSDYPSNPNNPVTFHTNLPEDVMSYDSLNDFFNNTTFNTTAANFTSFDPKLFPNYQGTNILTQNSFSYLQTVLGARPADSHIGVVDENILIPVGFNEATLNLVDPGYYAQPNTPNQSVQPVPVSVSGALVNGILSPGGYDAYQLQPTSAGWPQVVSVVPTAGSSLTLMVYDETSNQLTTGGVVAFGRGNQAIAFTPTRGHAYDLVVVGQPGPLGGFSFAIGSVQTYLRGQTIQMRDANQVLKGRLTIASQQPDGVISGTFVPNDSSGTTVQIGGLVGPLVDGSSSFFFAGNAAVFQTTGSSTASTTVETSHSVFFSGQVSSAVRGFVANGGGCYTVAVTTTTVRVISHTVTTTSSTQIKEQLPFVYGSTPNVMGLLPTQFAEAFAGSSSAQALAPAPVYPVLNSVQAIDLVMAQNYSVRRHATRSVRGVVLLSRPATSTDPF